MWTVFPPGRRGKCFGVSEIDINASLCMSIMAVSLKYNWAVEAGNEDADPPMFDKGLGFQRGKIMVGSGQLVSQLRWIRLCVG